MRDFESSTSVEHRALQKRNRELSILNSIAQALHREIDLARALDVVLAQVADLFGLHTGWIFLTDESDVKEPHSYLAASHNLPSALVDDPMLLTGTCYCLDTFHSGDLAGAANVNVITCSRLKKLVSGTNGLRFHASIPLYAQGRNQGRKLGVLNVASADWDELSEDDLRLLYTVGDLLSIAIERAQLFEQSAHFGAIEERNRLAREIHDTLAQGFSGIALQLETVDALLESSAAEQASDGVLQKKARSYVQKALEVARTNLDEARRSVLDLRAAPLEGRTLASALGLLATNAQHGETIQIRFEEEGVPIALPKGVEAGLYRIAQEALQNACLHAEATHIVLKLGFRSNKIALDVVDDGRGFSSTEANPKRFGLLGMNERARLLGGELSIESEPKVGTKISVRVPIDKTRI